MIAASHMGVGGLIPQRRGSSYRITFHVRIFFLQRRLFGIQTGFQTNQMPVECGFPALRPQKLSIYCFVAREVP